MDRQDHRPRNICIIAHIPTPRKGRPCGRRVLLLFLPPHILGHPRAAVDGKERGPEVAGRLQIGPKKLMHRHRIPPLLRARVEEVK
jgi:hypothetical protein